MEYASGGELFDYIVSKRSLPENESCDLKLYYIIYKKVIYKLIIYDRITRLVSFVGYF